MVTYSNSLLLEAIEGATIVSGEIQEGEGVTLYFADGRVFFFVSEAFALQLMRRSVEKLH